MFHLVKTFDEDFYLFEIKSERISFTINDEDLSDTTFEPFVFTGNAANGPKSTMQISQLHPTLFKVDISFDCNFCSYTFSLTKEEGESLVNAFREAKTLVTSK